MASQAKVKFQELLGRAALLSAQAAKLKRKQEAQAKAVFLHAALTTQVAAWDVYVKALAVEYFLAAANNSDQRFTALHTLIRQAMEQAKEKLNTPNSENSRTFLLNYTGFDPWSCWSGVKFGSITFGSTLHARERLNEILKLRHSFAHGFTMPVYSWNQDSTGAGRLTCATVNNTSSFFISICGKTDAGMSAHIAQQHGIAKPW